MFLLGSDERVEQHCRRIVVTQQPRLTRRDRQWRERAASTEVRSKQVVDAFFRWDERRAFLVANEHHPQAVLHDCQGAGVDSDLLDSIFDGGNRHCVALELRWFVAEQLGDFGPEILDLLGRTREPD